MKLTRRQILLIVWFVAFVCAGLLVGSSMHDWKLGLATSLSVLGVSLGVPLMRVFTELSK